ncbi:MAG: SDR family oxidoreductase [SAR324 cluster bacterium]|nr:SDR family oxidoreductase [SAR324 cluster bacterium]
MKNIKNVIFGTGPLGWWIMESLLEKGEDEVSITMVNRSGKLPLNLPQTLPKRVDLRAGDATDASFVAAICKDADAVFHCAMPPYTRWPQLFPALTKGILEGVKTTKAKLIYCDNLYMYGDTQTRVLTEDLPNNPHGHKGKVRAEMAESLLSAHRAGEIKLVVGRGSDFYGPYVINSGLGERFFKPGILGETADLLGDLALPHTYTYIKDFARALVLLSEEDAAIGQIWHVPNAPTITTMEMVSLVEQELGQSVKVRTAGPLMVNLLGLFIPMLKEMKEVMYQWNRPYVVDHSKFIGSFNLQTTDPKIAIKETLGWYRQAFSK